MTEAQQPKPNGGIPDKDLSGLDALAKQAIKLAAARNDPNTSGEAFGDMLVALLEASRAEALKVGRALGILQGRNEMVGQPMSPPDKPMRSRKTISLNEAKTVREEYDALVSKHGGIRPYGILSDLARKYGLSVPSIARICNANPKDNHA